MAKSGVETLKKGPIKLGEFGGRERYLKFDLNAFAEMETIYGDMKTAQKCLSSGKMKDVKNMLWLGLIHDEAIIDEDTGDVVSYKITRYQVGGWLDTDNMPVIMKKLQEAVGTSLPEDKKTKKVEQVTTEAALAAADPESADDPN